MQKRPSPSRERTGSGTTPASFLAHLGRQQLALATDAACVLLRGSDGFRVSVRIITASVEQAVLVPLGALFPHGKGMAVYRLDGREARLQPVEVGARNNNEAWLRSGLTEGQTVIVYPPATLRDGSKARVRKP